MDGNLRRGSPAVLGWRAPTYGGTLLARNRTGKAPVLPYSTLEVMGWTQVGHSRYTAGA